MSTKEMMDLIDDIDDLEENDPYLGAGRAYDRLETEYYEYGSLSIGYDFDSTVHDYHKLGVTHEKVIMLLRDLKSIGCKCICWTCYPDLSYVIKYCKDNDIPCDGVNSDGLVLPWTSRKPFFSALLDDRSGLLQVYLDLSLLVYSVKMGKEDESGIVTGPDNRLPKGEQRREVQPTQGLGGVSGIGTRVEPISPEA